MTDQLSPLAVQNAPLLRAIASGTYGSRAELAGAADIVVNNLNRKLESLLAEGLIVSCGDATYEVELTDLARRALAAVDVFDGAPATVNQLAEQTLIPLELLDFSPFNPRRDASQSDLPALAASIADKGVMQPIMVRPIRALGREVRFEIIMGERRVRASRLAVEQGLVKPTFAIPAQVRDMTDDEAFEAAGVENLHREDFHWLDEAEWYLGLAERGRSAAQIIRLIGEGGRKKRTIQQFIQVARELDEDAKRRARLPEGDLRRLSLEQARFMVGNRRERPALELSPKMALAMVELIFSRREGELKVGDGVIVTPLHKRPQGGALTILADRSLTRFTVAPGGVIEARTAYTVDLDKWLTQIGFITDPAKALHQVRAAAVGELAAARVSDGQYLTPELNPPERVEPSASLMGDDDEQVAEDDDGFLDDDDAYEAAMGDFRARIDDLDATPSTTYPDGGAAPIVAVAPLIQVAPAHALVISELAHALQRQTETVTPESAGAAPSVAIRNSYYKDPIAQAMIHDRLLMFLTQGPSTYAALTPRAYAWLDQIGVDTDEAGRFDISDDSLRFQQLQLGLPAGRHTYMTEWLRPAEPEAAHAVRDTEEPLSPAQGSPHGPGGFVGDAFSQQLRESADSASAQTPVAPTSVPAGVLQRLLAAAREAKRLVELGTTTRLKTESAEPGLAMLAGAMGDAERALAPKAAS